MLLLAQKSLFQRTASFYFTNSSCTWAIVSWQSWCVRPNNLYLINSVLTKRVCDVQVAVAGLFERSTTLAYVALASVMSFLVVPVVMHWLWSTNGWYDVCVCGVCVLQYSLFYLLLQVVDQKSGKCYCLRVGLWRMSFVSLHIPSILVSLSLTFTFCVVTFTGIGCSAHGGRHGSAGGVDRGGTASQRRQSTASQTSDAGRRRESVDAARRAIRAEIHRCRVVWRQHAAFCWRIGVVVGLLWLVSSMLIEFCC